MTATSSLSKFLSSTTLVALGTIFGFAIFHSALQYRIEQTEYNHNTTLAIVTGRFDELEKQRDRCIETDEGRLQEIYDLRGRLDAQHRSWHDLTTAQRSIVTRQRENDIQIQQFRDVYEQDQRTLESLRAEAEQKDREKMAIQEDLQHYHQTVDNLESKLRNTIEERHQLHVQIQNKDQESSSQIQQFRGETQNLQVQMEHKDLELKNLRNHLSRLSNQQAQLEKDARELQMRIRQKDEEIDSVKKNSDSLQTKIEKMESQISEKDNELFKYREEEGDLEKKLINFREGMLGLLTEKIHEIQGLEKEVDLLTEEKAALELKLDNWREGMLALVKEKSQEIKQLKEELAKSRETMKSMMHEFEQARSEQVKLEDLEREQEDTIDQLSYMEEEEMVKFIQDVDEARTKHEESGDWVVVARKEIERFKSDEALITAKTNEIKDLKIQIETKQKLDMQEISRLSSYLEEARRLVNIKTNQIEQLNSNLGGFVLEINDLKMGLTESSFKTNDLLQSTTSEMIIDHVQKRDAVICRQLFGKGPYYVKFVVRLPSDDQQDNTAFFVIELSFRKELPHSTYTFLSLVESSLYNGGVAFLSARDGGGLKIGSHHSRDATSLEQKQKPLGLTGDSSLSFVESSTSGEALPCGKHSFGFIHRGPELNLFLLDEENDEEKNDSDCFAHIIRGQENLHNIQSLLLESVEQLEILSVTHLRVD